MIKANFNTYNNYITDSLYQWDVNQDLVINGLNLSAAPEIHFANANMDRAIVRQSTLEGGVVTVRIPNSLLQEALTIKAYVGIYEGDTFKVIETIEIPVIAKARPFDYVFEDTDGEIYSYNAILQKLEESGDAYGRAKVLYDEMSERLEAETTEIVKTAFEEANAKIMTELGPRFNWNIDRNLVVIGAISGTVPICSLTETNSTSPTSGERSILMKNSGELLLDFSLFNDNANSATTAHIGTLSVYVGDNLAYTTANVEIKGSNGVYSFEPIALTVKSGDLVRIKATNVTVSSSIGYKDSTLAFKTLRLIASAETPYTYDTLLLDGSYTEPTALEILNTLLGV